MCVLNYTFINPAQRYHFFAEYANLGVGKKVGKLQIGVFDADDGTDEIIRADIDGVVPVFVSWSDGIRSAFELGIEAGHIGV